MAGILVTASKGVMDSVLAKLNELIGDKCANLLGVSSDILFLRDELSAMRALLENLEDTDGLDRQVKTWRDHVREMAYDIEDCIDDLTNNSESADAKAGFLNRASDFLKNCRAYLETARKIKELKTRLGELDERRKRYKVDEYMPSTTSATIDPRVSALYKEAASLVGIDGPKEELINLVVHDQSQQLKVLSIVGFGGLGKTTLANAVYRQVGGQFDCKAFVSVSQKPDITKILDAMLSELGQNSSSSNACREERNLNKLIEYLRDKRYLIVIDDLWGVPEWENRIKCAFPRNNRCSRVIITTRDARVARACSSDHGRCIYNMKPLSDRDSRKLFFNRIFGSEVCPPEFTDVSREILKKCSGLPLAIITIASILACEGPTTSPRKQWKCIQKSLAAQLATNNPTLEGMMYILNLSYRSLPRRLRECFLYLGIYPEDHEIRKADLVRQWVAEGFVRKDAWDVAESYLNELVNRSMIQPVYYDEYNFELSHFKVHDMMLDLILRRCEEDNFISLLHDPARAVAESPQYKVRRLSIDLRGMEDGSITLGSHLPHVRCFAMFGTPEQIPPLSEFKFLRVLFIEISRPNIKLDLAGISHLSQLRYLKVTGPYPLSIVLPGQIRRLRHLGTLELPYWQPEPCRIPSDIVELPCLSHLIVPDFSALPEGIGKAKSLHTLNGFCLLKCSSENIEGLGELTNLETLEIQTKERYPSTPRWMTALNSSLEKLGNLKVLAAISRDVYFCADAVSSWVSPPFPNLEELSLYGWTFSRVPRWMGDLCNLHTLYLGAMEILQEDVDMIGTRLPSLARLGLRVPGLPAERIVINGFTGFSVLKFLRLEWDGNGLSFLTFEAGAMRELQRIHFIIDPRKWDGATRTPAGLQHLSSLKSIDVWMMMRSSRATIEFEGTALIKTVFQEAAEALPSRPEINWSEPMYPRRIEVGEDGLELEGRAPRITPSSSSPPVQ